jgi:hypothetical protein
MGRHTSTKKSGKETSMKRTIMAVLVAGVLLLSVGSAALAADATSGGNIYHPAVTGWPSSGLSREAGGASGGVLGDRQKAQAGGLNGGVVGSKSGADSVQAGGLRGGVVLGTDPVLAGGKGGIWGDTVVIAGGRVGGGGDFPF